MTVIFVSDDVTRPRIHDRGFAAQWTEVAINETQVGTNNDSFDMLLSDEQERYLLGTLTTTSVSAFFGVETWPWDENK